MATAVMLQPEVPKAPVSNDNVQDLLKRKRELEMNKRRYHLTEADASLLLTNANEFSFEDGQVIGHEGDNLNSAYRVKSGTIALKRDGHKICTVTQVYISLLAMQQQPTLYPALHLQTRLPLFRMATPGCPRQRHSNFPIAPLHSNRHSLVLFPNFFFFSSIGMVYW